MGALGPQTPREVVFVDSWRTTSHWSWNQEEDWRGSIQGKPSLAQGSHGPARVSLVGTLALLRPLFRGFSSLHLLSLPASQGRLPMATHPLHPLVSPVSSFCENDVTEVEGQMQVP